MAEIRQTGNLHSNTRRLTNIGTFRAYLQQYLKAHAKIQHGMTLLVRQLKPGSEGLPIEISCSTDTTAWADCEDIQADIFDHILAILPEFGLSVFQGIGGTTSKGEISKPFDWCPNRTRKLSGAVRTLAREEGEECSFPERYAGIRSGSW
ncbi:mechanosensitive ion channel domain-containing protein [Candidatus Halocynthiibacter alkanivorans]|uniref:mechanosensitive ion channel domain-containing protein n=1 Tax=Candidatus Halocynthiibacter alkanivorans TaxID=2267619 RepID=UPI002350C29A|nr:mechanosensitive ion channel domain-containing protein [Candidatus Halocynthiibacter alkanivorans]